MMMKRTESKLTQNGLLILSLNRGNRTKHSMAVVIKTKAWKAESSREDREMEANITALKETHLETKAAGTP